MYTSTIRNKVSHKLIKYTNILKVTNSSLLYRFQIKDEFLPIFIIRTTNKKISIVYNIYLMHQ